MQSNLNEQERTRLRTLLETWSDPEKWLRFWYLQQEVLMWGSAGKYSDGGSADLEPWKYLQAATSKFDWKDVTIAVDDHDFEPELNVSLAQVEDLRNLVERAMPGLYQTVPSMTSVVNDVAEIRAKAQRIATCLAPLLEFVCAPSVRFDGPPPASGQPLDENCATFIWNGKTYSFTHGQADIVERLWLAHRHDGNWNGMETSRLFSDSKGANEKRLRDVFKSKKRCHEAWGDLIVATIDPKDKRRRRYRLNLL